MDVSTAREPAVDLRDVGQKTLRNGGISQLQTVLGLLKTEELGGDWWSRLWSPTFSNEEGPGKARQRFCTIYSISRKVSIYENISTYVPVVKDKGKGS